MRTYNERMAIIENLVFDEAVKIFSDETGTIFIRRPSLISERFQDYDVNRNFRIMLIKPFEEVEDFIEEPDYEYGERVSNTHMSVFDALNSMSQQFPWARKALARMVDRIAIEGIDPEEAVAEYEKVLSGAEPFIKDGDSLRLIAHLIQMFVLEQDIGYPSSNYVRGSMWFLGWCRAFVIAPEIGNRFSDAISGPIAHRPTGEEYTLLDNEAYRKIYGERQGLYERLVDITGSVPLLWWWDEAAEKEKERKENRARRNAAEEQAIITKRIMAKSYIINMPLKKKTNKRIAIRKKDVANMLSKVLRRNIKTNNIGDSIKNGRFSPLAAKKEFFPGEYVFGVKLHKNVGTNIAVRVENPDAASRRRRTRI